MKEEMISIPLSMYNQMAHAETPWDNWVAFGVGMAIGLALTPIFRWYRWHG